MAALVDDLAKNDIFFRSPDFVNAFHLDYKAESDTNYEFVRAFTKVLNGTDHKKALNDWGEE